MNDLFFVFGIALTVMAVVVAFVGHAHGELPLASRS